MVQPAKTLLLVIDPQRAFCDADGSMARQGRPIEHLRQAACACDALAQEARLARATVAWTRMVFAPDYSDGGELIATIRPNLAKIGALRRGSGDEELSDVVTPHDGDIVIDKPRFSALVNTGLEAILHDGFYRRILVCGMTTSMCVESTVRDLGQRDFQTFVVADACADFDRDVHKASLAAMEFGFARILDSHAARDLLRTPDNV